MKLAEQAYGKTDVACDSFEGATFALNRGEGGESEDPAPSSHKRRPRLRQLNAKNVDAVYAEGSGAINSLRDVQVSRVVSVLSPV